MTEERVDRAEEPRAGYVLPLALFLLALAINLVGISWGLPNGNATWAADSIQPGAPLSVLNRLLLADGWNSGWFWFKYPLGHVFVLGAAYAPYLYTLIVGGGLSNPTGEYPHGFSDPELVFSTLALLGRWVSATMGAGCVVLVYLLVVRPFGRAAATLAALLTAFCYPVVYYSHTTNVEVPYLFWMLLALLAAVRLLEPDARRAWWAVLAIGAAMSVSTKELAAGAFVGMAIGVAVVWFPSRKGLRELIVGGLLAAVTFAAVLVAANAVPLNPQGFLNRIGFLTQTLPREIALKYAPYYFPIDLGVARGADVEFTQLATAARRVQESLGWPALVAGVLGLGVAARRSPRWTVVVVAAGIGFYLLGLRAMLSLSLRYVLPLAVLLSATAGIGLAALGRRGSAALPRRAAVLAVLAFTVAYGVDVDRMIAFDGRYEAERWLERNAHAGDAVEVYQRPTYLPRMPERIRAVEVAFDDRTPEGLAERSPHFVVLSSAGRSGVSVRYRDDWQADAPETPEGFEANQISAGGEVMNYRRTANEDMIDALEDGSLGYREVGRFQVRAWIERPLIQSLNPEIVIYARADAMNRARPDTAAAPKAAPDATPDVESTSDADPTTEAETAPDAGPDDEVPSPAAAEKGSDDADGDDTASTDEAARDAATDDREPTTTDIPTDIPTDVPTDVPTEAPIEAPDVLPAAPEPVRDAIEVFVDTDDETRNDDADGGPDAPAGEAAAPDGGPDKDVVHDTDVPHDADSPADEERLTQ